MSMFVGDDPSMAVLAAALAVDAFWGEPPNPLHPVVWMGKGASWLEKLAPKRGARLQLAAGAVIAVLLPSACAGAGLLVGNLDELPFLWFIASALLLKSTFAARALGRAALEVRGALARGRVADARRALRSLCARDPNALDAPLVASAAIESLAENASDSVVAPLFYYALFGLPGALFYRAVNTLDAMIGYRGRYEHLGKASARFDDLLNFIPARLTAALLVAAGWFRRDDVRGGWAVWRRDGRKTESPNAGRPMAAMAGLLRVQLEKVGHYRLGDPGEVPGVRKIDDAWRLVRLGAGIGAGVVVLALGVRHGCTL